MDRQQTEDLRPCSTRTEAARPAPELDLEMLDDISVAEAQITQGAGVRHDEARRQVLGRIMR